MGGGKNKKQGSEDLVVITEVQYTDGKKEKVKDITRSGQVSVKYSNGDKYEGGVVKKSTGAVVKEGNAKFTWASGATYVGKYVNDKKEGAAVYTSANGDVFEGTFINNLKEGKGKHTYKNGDVFHGSWKTGKREGPGKYIYANGKVVNSVWKNGAEVEGSRRVEGEVPKINGPGFVIAGAPLSGKGTQAKKIQKKLGVIHLDARDVLKEAIGLQTAWGMKAKAYQDKKVPIPDEVMVQIIAERLGKPDVVERGYVLDGFPENGTQAKELANLGIKIDSVLLLSVPDEAVVERIQGRRIDPETGEIYHVTHNPPPKDVAERVVKLEDDNEETARARLEEYHKNFDEVKEAFKEFYKGQAIEIDGSLQQRNVWSEVKEALELNTEPLGVIIAGAPASGKGTQCEYMKDKHGLVHLSTGDMLRAAIREGTEVGMKAKEFMDNGKLVPDEIVIEIIRQRIEQDDVKEHGFLLDGFPRTPAQAQALREMGIKVDMFLLLNVPDDKLVERVVGRRIDPVTGNSYHVKFAPPPAEIADRLETRADDTEDKVRERLKHFHGNINSIMDQFSDKLKKIDGDLHKDAVWEQVDDAINRVLDFK